MGCNRNKTMTKLSHPPISYKPKFDELELFPKQQNQKHLNDCLFPI